MLGQLLRGNKPDERTRKELEKKRDELIRKAGKMRKLVESDSGWREYCALLDEYVEACKKRKALTALDRADARTIEELRLLDHEVWFITQFIKKIPEQIFVQEKKMLEAAKEEDQQ